MSELSTGFKILRRIVKTGSMKSLLKYCIEPCEKCGKRPIDIHLDKLIGIETKKCLKCRAALTILDIATGITVPSFALDNTVITDVMRKSYWRKAIISLIKGILYFGPNKPFATGSPLLIVWNFTNQCNLKCKHCYQNATPSALTNELTTEEALKLVEQFAEADVTTISFSGGEPLFRRDIYEVAGRAKELGIYVSIATNGTLITKEVAQKLTKAAHYAEISLDGATPQVHDSFRGTPGAWEKTIQGIKNCVEAGLFTTIATTATKTNLKEIPQLIELTKQNQAEGFFCFNFIPTGRATEITNIDLTPTEREDLLKLLYEEMIESMIKKGPKIFSAAPQFTRVGLEQSKLIQKKMHNPGSAPAIPVGHYGNLPGLTSEVAGFIGGCGAGRVYCGLTPDGILTPCVFMPIPVGDLRKEKLEDIWLNSPILNDLRDREKLVGRCGKCSYKYVCGGCRARAYGYFGNYLYPDPGCARSLEVPLSENVPSKT